MAEGSPRALWDDYDVAMLDLDGVVYIGPDAVPGAPGHLAAARRSGMRLAYVTNNASRPPSRVAAHLRELGIEVADEDVVTSAQAAARLLAERLDDGAAVFVIGGEGLERALTEAGLRPVQDADEAPVAVVSGFNADLRWSTVIAGAILVRDGLPWVASNTDMTVPTPTGPGPGNGALVRAVAEFAGREPEVAGKPRPPLFEETLRRVGGRRPLVVGDRLDTDIEGGNATGYDTLLVMTGVTGPAELVGAPDALRPTYVGADLGALGRPGEPVTAAAKATVGPWTARVVSGVLRVTGAATGAATDGTRGDDTVAPGELDQWWQAVAAAGWAHHDATGGPADVSGLRVPGSVGPETEDPDEPAVPTTKTGA